jgi:hypothetical protein
MSIFLLKSLLSVILTFLSIVSMYTMFEVFGRNGKKVNTVKMIKIHKMNGVFYFIVFAVVSYFCLSFIAATKSELSVRSAFHGICALSIFIFLAVKIAYVRVYRQFYHQVKIFGLVMALLTFVTAGISGGYYLLVSEFGTDESFDKIMQYKNRLAQNRVQGMDEAMSVTIKSDPESMGRGKGLFDSKCRFCHDAYSTDKVVGPGLKGIMKKDRLPVSKRPSTPGNIILQLKTPFDRMPSFEYLSAEETSDIIAFLHTL